MRDRFITDIEQIRRANEIELEQTKRSLKQQAYQMLQGYIGKLNDKYDKEIGKKRLNLNNKRQDIKDKDEEINYLKSLIADQENKLM